MADWKHLRDTLPGIVHKLEPGSQLTIFRDSPEVRFQFAVPPSGGVLWSEVCNETAEDEPSLREKGWVMVDEWSGVWRRTTELPATLDEVQEAVNEVLRVLVAHWQHRNVDGFGYLAWLDRPERAWWQFWKPKGEEQLKFPELELPAGRLPA